MHRFRFWPQNSLQMANTIKNWISLNLQESEKNEKNTSNDLTSFFLHFLVMFSNKNGCARIKKLVKTLMEFFQKFSILTENLVDFDATFSVILSTVHSTKIGCVSALKTTYVQLRILTLFVTSFIHLKD